MCPSSAGCGRASALRNIPDRAAAEDHTPTRAARDRFAGRRASDSERFANHPPVPFPVPEWTASRQPICWTRFPAVISPLPAGFTARSEILRAPNAGISRRKSPLYPRGNLLRRDSKWRPHRWFRDQVTPLVAPAVRMSGDFLAAGEKRLNYDRLTTPFRTDGGWLTPRFAARALMMRPACVILGNTNRRMRHAKFSDETDDHHRNRESGFGLRRMPRCLRSDRRNATTRRRQWSWPRAAPECGSGRGAEGVENLVAAPARHGCGPSVHV